MPVSRLLWDEAVLAMFQAAMPASTPGDLGQAPAGVTDSAGRIIKQHFVLRPLPSAVTEVSLEDPHEILRLEYQLDSNGSNWRQSQWVADKIRSVWVGTTGSAWTYPITVPSGHYCSDRIVALMGGPNSDAPGAYSTIDNLYLVVN